MQSCAVYGCTNNSLISDSDISYYPFPKNEYLQQWSEACGWNNDCSIDPYLAHICSLHFDELSYIEEITIEDGMAVYKKTLKEDAVPNLYLPPAITIKEQPPDVQDFKNLVVYSLNCTDNASTSTRVEPSTSKFTVGNQMDPLCKPHVLKEKYSCIKNYSELQVLQATNENLRKRAFEMENQVAQLEQLLKVKEEFSKALEQECNEIEKKLSDKKLSAKDENLSITEQRKILSQVFSEAQIRIILGKKKAVWSDDDMAVGYIIRNLSNKRCYTYLSKTLNIPLPAVSCIQRWISQTREKTNVKDENVAESE